MQAAYFVLFLSFSLLAQTKPEIKLVPAPQTLEDFGHEHKGCPENSECDPVMGLQMQRWKELTEKLETQDLPAGKKAQLLELFRQKHGIPVEFYTTKKSQQGFRPLFFNSGCKEHNPKDESQKTLRGTAFIKSIGLKGALVWRDQAQIEVPLGSLLFFQPVTVYGGATPAKYELPLEDQPLFIKDKSLYVLKEEDGLFFMLKVGPTGDWKIEDVDLASLAQWENKRETVACPSSSEKATPSPFKEEFCKSIWDEDLKKGVVVKMARGCTI